MSSYQRDREIYLREDRYENPKVIFKHLEVLASRSGNVRPGAKVCDVGCAAGEFLYYFSKLHPETECTGFDQIPDLVAKARSMAPRVRFLIGSLADRNILAPQSQDIVFMSGVHSSLPDIRLALNTLVEWTKPGGRIYVFGIFNPHPLDVACRYKHPESNDAGTDFYIHSRAGISLHLDRMLGPGRHSFEPFELDLDVPQHPEDPFRSWTFKDIDGKRRLTNGLCTLIQCDVLEIKP